jgi:hypothetical protein
VDAPQHRREEGGKALRLREGRRGRVLFVVESPRGTRRERGKRVRLALSERVFSFQ